MRENTFLEIVFFYNCFIEQTGYIKTYVQKNDRKNCTIDIQLSKQTKEYKETMCPYILFVRVDRQLSSCNNNRYVNFIC